MRSFFINSKIYLKKYSLYIYIYIYMCVCVCVYCERVKCIYISSSSYRAGSTDIPDPLSPLLPIVHRPR